MISQIEAAERAPHRLKRIGPRPLIDRDADAIVSDPAEIDAVVDGVLQDQSLIWADLYGDRIEVGGGVHFEAER